jgi:uncharacterized cupredoxin-like copper-binding protein
MSTSLLKIAVVPLALLALGACAADSKPAPGTSGKPVPSGSSSSSSSASESASTDLTLTVGAAEPATDTFTFDTNGTNSLPAGTVIVTFKNFGTTLYDLHIVKINDGNFSAYRTALMTSDVAPDTLGQEAGKSLPIDPGEKSTFSVDLTPGTYALVCFITAPDGKTYAQHGMIRELTVSPA